MTKLVYYVFDPLCGWCYAASKTVAALDASRDVELRMLPNGLFLGSGARPMDDAMATHAWTNDQRIERLTGQHFSERYRDDVLGDRREMFDSGPATLALTAVSMTEPKREAEALAAIQRARYIDGRQTTWPEILAEVLSSLNLLDAVSRLHRPDSVLLNMNQVRINKGQALLFEARTRGVPAFVIEKDGHPHAMNTALAYTDPEAFLAELLSDVSVA